MPASVRQSSVLSQLVHWWFSRREIECRRIRPPLEIEPSDHRLLFRFEGALRSPSAPGMDDPASVGGSVERPAARKRSRDVISTPLPSPRRPLRTAEQARASLKFRFCKSSYEEPTVDALAPRTDEGRE